SVAVPAGDVRRAKTRHGLRLHDHIFQNLVQTRAQVDLAGRIGWAVMKHIQRRALARLEDAVIEPHLLPGGQLLRLALRQFRFHREISFGEVESTLQVGKFGHLVGLVSPFLSRAALHAEETSGALRTSYVTMIFKACQPDSARGFVPFSAQTSFLHPERLSCRDRMSGAGGLGSAYV